MNCLFLAAAPLAQKFEFGRIQNEYDWYIYAAVLLVILAPVTLIYRRDAAELPGLLRFGLPLFRTAVLVGLLFVYLQPRWRSEREERFDSRVLLMVDTSRSMGLTDAESGPNAGHPRLEQVASALDNTDFIKRLRKKHQVTVIPFNSGIDAQGRVVLPKDAPVETPKEGTSAEGNSKPAEALATAVAAPSWKKQLALGGNDTRLGDAMEQTVRDERNTPVSGMVVISDGGLNAGAPVDAALDLARESHIPIYTIGVGSEKRPTSASVVEFHVPPRVFPGEHFSVEGSLQGSQMQNRTVTVELLAREGAAANDRDRAGQGRLIESREVTLAGDGEAVPVKFDVPPQELGKHVLCLRIKSASVAPRDRRWDEESFEVSTHKTHVLLLAGGPMRDYQYLRTMLFRDKSVVVDVLLQSGQPGISQEAAKILTQFPTTRSEMYTYDCLVAFDPDWAALSSEQVDLLYDWVDQDHGGMVVVAGPVNTARTVDGWVQKAELAKIRQLYPVEFNSGLTTKTNLMYGSEDPWRLDFTREGVQAPFLWLGDSAVASQATWSQFAGVYSYCPVRDKKAGATVLARFSDPRTAVDGQQPIYMAVHRFSASPIVYLGSAETWRLRRLNPAWFEMLWTKLVRYASQEHLRRQSARGTLVIDRDSYQVGSTVEVKAELKNSDFSPLLTPQVMLDIVRDEKEHQTLPMPADPSRPGRYRVDVPVAQKGKYQIELLIPHSEERLTRTFSGMVPKLEDENPQRNARLLREIAEKTEGLYFPDIAAALSDSASPSLVDMLRDVSRRDTIPESPKPEDDEKLFRWMLIALCSVLCLEWLVRRLAKLA